MKTLENKCPLVIKKLFRGNRCRYTNSKCEGLEPEKCHLYKKYHLGYEEIKRGEEE